MSGKTRLDDHGYGVEVIFDTILYNSFLNYCDARYLYIFGVMEGIKIAFQNTGKPFISRVRVYLKDGVPGTFCEIFTGNEWLRNHEIDLMF